MDIMGFVNDYVMPHWPFFTWLFIAMLVGQVVKKTVWTKLNAAKYANPKVERSFGQKLHHWFFWWGRKTMVLHPVLAGALLGTVWQNPEHADPAWGLPTSMGYFAMAGGLSTWAYEFLRGVAKKKGVNLDIPGLESQRPPPPEK
jgi:hypothetical protein